MKSKRPWLTSTGVEIPTKELREISARWDRSTWEEYLKWYESVRIESLLPPDIFLKRAERMTKSALQLLDHNTDQRKRILCERLLASIPPDESKVLRHVYFEGRTIREIAAIEKTAKSTVQWRKNKALTRLRRGRDGNELDTHRYMRGINSEAQQSTPSPWDQSLSLSIREDKVYEPGQCKEELEKIQHAPLRKAIATLSERERRILYLRFWCDYPVSEIARDLRSGVNLIEQVLDAAISKLKRRILSDQNRETPGEGPSCA